jgi:hypothetical protein
MTEFRGKCLFQLSRTDTLDPDDFWPKMAVVLGTMVFENVSHMMFLDPDGGAKMFLKRRPSVMN